LVSVDGAVVHDGVDHLSCWDCPSHGLEEDFAFLIDGLPVRFNRDAADDQSRRTLRQQEKESEQPALLLGLLGGPARVA
jgi:hypothetical protein